MANKKQKKPHLGKGLSALLSSTTLNTSGAGLPGQGEGAVGFPPDEQLKDAIQMIATADLTPNPYQPRTSWNEEDLRDLAQSIRTNGIIQPILARRVAEGFEVIAGERRLRAAEMVGLTEVPALVRDASDVKMLELALIENIHRTELNPIERAVAYQEFVSSFSLTQAQAAERLGQNRSVIANHLRLLDLPSEIKKMLVDGALSMGHARAILALPTDDVRRKLANRAMAGRLSVREVERLVRLSLEADRPAKKPAEKAANILDLEKRLRDALGTKVQINASRRGQRGRIIVEYYSHDEFDRITEKMGLVKTEEM